ncbi:hypothetical protein HA466_0220320 [Hirschfeldia incana]|nr:hypothetical protein HA466_0220320 [Hirschfeldia incana]
MPIEGTFTLEPFVYGAFGGVTGGICGGILGMAMSPEVRRCFRVLAPLSRAQCARMVAREISVFTASLFAFEPMTRDNHDLKSRLVSASVAGLASSFLSKGMKVRPAYALFYVASFPVELEVMYKINEISISATSEDSTRGDAFDT